MGRPKDQKYWNQVEKLKDGKLQCRRCKHMFKGGVSRIKAHVDRIQGQGIKLCDPGTGSVRDSEGVDNPQEAENPLQVAGGADETIGATIAGSTNHELINFLKDLEHVEDMMRSGHSGFETEISQIEELVHKLIHEEGDIEGQLEWLESRGKACRRQEVDDWRKRGTYWKNEAREIIEFLGQRMWADPQEARQRLTARLRDHMTNKPLVLSNELVGKSFETNIKELLKLLGDDKVLIIGIHGMGGVGKTCLVTHIKNEITRKGTFKHVFWVTVSQRFSIFKLQNDIAKRIGVKLEEDDEIMRAEILSSALEEKEKCVLILDDVWNYIDLQKVGIPLRVNGIKLVMTSRLDQVCRQMDCHIIRMELLSCYDDDDDSCYKDDGWELFLLKLGKHGKPAILPHGVEKIAESVARKCHGLRLGISVMARTMKGVNNIHGWRHALNKLENSAMGEEMEEEVFKVLKLSYDHLMDKKIQNCFLHCALYHKIERFDLIMKLVDEGLINGMSSLEEIFDEGHTILDKLIGHSLLLGEYGNSLFLREYQVWMHGLMRDMVCHNILKERGMVRCDKGLTKIPHMHEWTADLEKVSLMHNQIKEIPAGTSPYCPRLSTLIFRDNPLSRIPDCFFSHMNALSVLDLTDNADLTCLPKSVSELRSLTSLLLGGCESLEGVPSLEQLQNLSRLVISGTSIKEVPQGLEMLINLKWLDLSWNDNLTLVRGSVLPGLTNMQRLDLRRDSVSANGKVNLEDVQGMSMLECFAGSFHDCEEFSDYVLNTLDAGCGPKTYHLHSGIAGSLWDHAYDIDTGNQNTIVCDCEEFAHLLPRDLLNLCISNNKQWRCLCDALSFNAPSSLRNIRIRHCPKLERLFCLSGSCSLCTRLQHLTSLYLDDLESLDVIWKENDEEDITKSLPPDNWFSNLSHLEIRECHRMEKLLTLGSLQQLPNLQTIEVQSCHKMREIFAVRSSEEDDDDYSTTTITLPKLTMLKLWNLPELKTVCRGIIVSGSPPIRDIHISGCPRLQGSLQYKSSDSNSDSVVLLDYPRTAWLSQSSEF